MADTQDSFITVGVGIDGSEAEQQLESEVLPNLVKALKEAGLEVPVDVKSLQQLNELVQSIGGSMTVLKDSVNDTFKSISVNFENLSGQLVKVKEGIANVADYDEDSKPTGTTHPETGTITASVSGQRQEYDALKQVQQDLISLAEQRQKLELQLYNAVESGDVKQIASLSTKREQNEALSKTYQEQYALLLQQENPAKSMEQILSQVESTANSIKESVGDGIGGQLVVGDDNELVTYANNVKNITDAIKEYNSALQAQIKSNKSEDSAEWQVIAERVNLAKTNVESYKDVLSGVGVELQEQEGILSATYSGGNESVKQFTIQVNQAAAATLKLSEASKDKQNDTELINQTVAAYKEYTAQILKLQKLDLSGQKNTTEYEQEAKLLEELKKQYQALESMETSYGVTVGNTTEYCRDKNQATRDLIQAQKELNATMDDSSSSLQNEISQLLAAAVSFDKIIDSIKKVISTTLELNKAMTNIQMVTQESTSTMKEYMEQYAELGAQIGATATDIASGAEEWFRQGANQEEALELAKASAVLQQTGGMEASEAVTSLTSAINGYQLAMEDAMPIVDKIVTLDVDLAV